MPFSFLHISDLHFDTELVNQEVFRNEIKRKIREDNLNANCLIISGDLFNRGTLDQKDVERYKEFLNDLPGREFTVVVPGNHDLNRSVQRKIETSYNIFRTRKALVLEKGNAAYRQGQFTLKEDEKEILYRGAYEAFFNFSRLMGFKSFYQENPSQEDSVYEVQVLPVDEPSLPCSIKFVLLNTGLIAGQSVGGNKYRERIRRLEKELDEATAAGDHVKAAEVQVRIAKQQKRYEDEGEMIIDEEDYTEEGPGRISLSREGLRTLSNIQATDTTLTIFVGHHGYQFFSKETKKALAQAMKNCRSGIYLCGHSHQAKYKRFKIGENTIPRDIDQIQAGVMYKGEGDYTQYGFDYGVFSVENNRIVPKITSYFLVRSASGGMRWLSEDIKITLDIRPTSQVETSANLRSKDQSETDANIINPPDQELKKPVGQDCNVTFTSPNTNSMTPPVSGPASRQALRNHFLNNN